LKISYGITVHNEAEELNKLLEILIQNIDKGIDEIVVCVDGEDDGVRFVLDTFTQKYFDRNTIKVYQRKLENDFAAQKNSVIENSSGDYIFHIDADEYPHEVLLRDIKKVLEMNEVDLIWVPRVNTVEGLTQEHIQKWGWKVTEKGWVNSPDYQARIFKRSDEIRWERPVHELIVGCKTYAHLPPNEELSLYHPKTIHRQEQQNELYEAIILDNYS